MQNQKYYYSYNLNIIAAFRVKSYTARMTSILTHWDHPIFEVVKVVKISKVIFDFIP